jgi:hypothetical protein
VAVKGLGVEVRTRTRVVSENAGVVSQELIVGGMSI